VACHRRSSAKAALQARLRRISRVSEVTIPAATGAGTPCKKAALFERRLTFQTSLFFRFLWDGGGRSPTREGRWQAARATQVLELKLEEHR